MVNRINIIQKTATSSSCFNLNTFFSFSFFGLYKLSNRINNRGRGEKSATSSLKRCVFFLFYFDFFPFLAL